MKWLLEFWHDADKILARIRQDLKMIYMLHVDIDAFLYSTYLQVSGTNLLRLPARDAYSYALSLVGIIFTKEELPSSLLFKSAKSEKPGLPKLGVDKLFGK